MFVTPEIRYQQALNKKGYIADPVQAETVKALQALYDKIIQPRKKHFLPQDWFSKSVPVKGLYLWGGVGRGKTWLMDTFYDCLPFDNKLRMHFHSFMRYAHEQLQKKTGHKNPLEQVAKELSHRTKILCFDEFFVSDITDAMILSGLLDGLFSNGVALVATSNVIPDELYKHGLQRARFLPAIELLKKYTTVLNVDGGYDYRLRALERAMTYHYPATASSHQLLQKTFIELTNNMLINPDTCEIALNNRLIDCIAQAPGVLWVTFSALCDGPRSQNDYIEIARLFHTIILEGVPQLSEDEDDQARRFISLIDELYDHSVTIIISAQTMPLQIYQGSQLIFEFQRTISRLEEMQSLEYIARPHVS